MNNKYIRLVLFVFLLVGIVYVFKGTDKSLTNRDIVSEEQNTVIDSHNRKLVGVVSAIEGDNYTLLDEEDSLVVAITNEAEVRLITTDQRPEPTNEEATPSTIIIEPITGSLSDIQVGDSLHIEQEKEGDEYVTVRVVAIKARD